MKEYTEKFYKLAEINPSKNTHTYTNIYIYVCVYMYLTSLGHILIGSYFTQMPR